ncbi:hypothetical protein CRYUN_Cryun26dG0019300 [Craigia yunnanensis]
MRRDWATKYRMIIGIAKGLCFLHHDCNPAISHGDLKSSNVVFDDNFEPRLADFGFKYLIQLIKGNVPATTSRLGTVDSTNSLREEIKPVVDVALLCTRSRPADRPSMEDALKLLSGSKPQGK